MSKQIDITSLKNAEIVHLHNTINPDNTVAKFKNAETGILRVNEVIAEQNKGKNKSLFATRVAGLPVAILTLLAPSVMMAKDLTTRLFPAQIQVLAKLKELGANESHINKADFHEAYGVAESDAKLADVFNDLYKNNFLIWEEDDTMMISEAANNFLEANPEVIDSTTLLADLQHVKAKATKKGGTGAGRSRTPDTHVITPLIKENPCQPAKNRFNMYAIWLGNEGADRITVKDYKDAGGIMFDLNVAVKQGQAAVQDPSEPEAQPVPKEPKPESAAAKKKREAKEAKEAEAAKEAAGKNAK